MMVLPLRESRRIQRTRFSAEQHFDAIDADLDELYALRDRDIASLNERFEALTREMQGSRAVLTGLLVAIAGGAIIGAVNILLHAI